LPPPPPVLWPNTTRIMNNEKFLANVKVANSKIENKEVVPPRFLWFRFVRILAPHRKKNEKQQGYRLIFVQLHSIVAR